MAQGHTDGSSRIAVLATRALESQYLAACGEPPRGARAFCDGPNLLLVLRPGDGGVDRLECETLPRRITESVRQRTGRTLRDGRWRSEPELGIEMFVFGLPLPERAEAATLRRSPTSKRRLPLASQDPVPADRRR
jgi:hypothetical protein